MLQFCVFIRMLCVVDSTVDSHDIVCATLLYIHSRVCVLEKLLCHCYSLSAIYSSENQFFSNARLFFRLCWAAERRTRCQGRFSSSLCEGKKCSSYSCCHIYEVAVHRDLITVVLSALVCRILLPVSHLCYSSSLALTVPYMLGFLKTHLHT